MQQPIVVHSARLLSRSELAAASFLARYSGPTLAGYTIDLRIFFAWCAQHELDPLDDVTRAHLELFARYLETDRGNARASVARRLITIRFFYRLAQVDDVIPKSPAEHIRIPRTYRDDSRVMLIDRNELGALVSTARHSGRPADAALIVMMGLMGLRVSEACNVQIRDTQHETRGHRVLHLVGKGGKAADLPIPIPVGRDIDRAIGDRQVGYVLQRADGTQMTRMSARRVVERIAKTAHVEKNVHPHALRHAFITAALDAGVPLRDVQIAARHSDPRQTARYDRARGNMDRSAMYVVSAFIAGAA